MKNAAIAIAIGHELDLNMRLFNITLIMFNLLVCEWNAILLMMILLS